MSTTDDLHPNNTFETSDAVHANSDAAHTTVNPTAQMPETQAASGSAPAAGAPVPPNPVAGGEHKAPKKKKGDIARGAIAGVCGGVLGSLAIVGILMSSGALNTGSVQTTESSAGKAITINASTTDAEVAQAVAAKALPSVVSVNVETADGEGLGSGVVLDTDGNIITNYHVINGATSITVTIDGKSYDASVVGSDASSDIAVIKANLNGDKVTPISVGDSDKLTVGSWVMTIGSPFGLDQSVSAGIVSSLARNSLMQSASGNTLYTNLIQTDASINPGNSGGALVNENGELVGISTLFSSDTESFAGIGFAIPGNYAVDIAKTIISGEKVVHAYIGLSLQTVNAQSATANNLSVSQGAYVADVSAGGPAEAAGIEKGDVITAINGEEISSADGLILNIRTHKVGETVTVTVNRKGESKDIKVTLGSDEALQEEQEKQRQQTTTDTGMPEGDNGESNKDIIERYIEQYLQNRNDSHGGSYETVTTTNNNTIAS